MMVKLPDEVNDIKFGEVVLGGRGVVEAHEVIKPNDGESLTDFATRLTTQWPDSSLRLKIRNGRPEYAIRQVI